MKRWIISLILLAATGGAIGAYFYSSQKGGNTQYRTTKVERGDISQTVRATGTIQPIKLVQVGTQVNGPIRKLYVDFNSQVKAGDLVAQIDPTTYEARLAQDQANLIQSQANVEQTRAKLIQADKELERTQKLTAREMLSQSDLDASIAIRDTLNAQMKVSEAAVAQAQAALRLSQANLGYTTISSPVDGVVINVSEGQTVVASMSAQVLFLIATDLRKIQVEASIPEADIGNVALGQQVVFNVDAYEENFTGKVTQIRMAASTVQNVVTYPVIIQADNRDSKLFPSMTADIVCEVAHHENVLKIPNAALRFKLDDRNAAESPAPPKGKGAAARAGRDHKVWLQNPETGKIHTAFVSLGITDGSATEVRGDASLDENQYVITGIQATISPEKTVNPFTPQMSGSSRRLTR
jgi:HlyD family secretion protein